MSEFLITQTPFSAVRRIDASVQLTGQRLRNILGQHLDKDELDETSKLFADPEPVVGAAATDWYTDYADDPVVVADLDPEAREAILAEVGRLCAAIANIADKIDADMPGSADAAYLRAAIAIPDNNAFIYALGKKPVIVAWGHKMAGSGKVPVPAGIWVKKAAPEHTEALEDEAQPVQTEDQSPRVLATGGVAHRPGIGWLAWLLWLLFLILFLIILWLVLTACSMGGPQTTLAQRLGLLNQCPVPEAVAQAPVSDQSRRSDILREAIREAELALAEDAQQCRVVRREEDEARRAALPEPSPPQEQAFTDEIDERVRDAGGQSGEMQIVLQWDGPADLDMRVNCSGGSISYSSRSACSGGELDVDANYEVHMDRPIENIRWDEMPPPGTYGLSIRNHSNRGDQRDEIPFEVLVRQGDEQRTYRGRVGQGQSVSVTDIRVE